jgi:heme O synthase-like polyprenyltransferase
MKFLCPGYPTWNSGRASSLAHKPFKSMQKRNTLTFAVLTLVGTGYFGIFSQINADAWLKGYLALLPIQLGILVYLLWVKRPLDTKS